MEAAKEKIKQTVNRKTHPLLQAGSILSLWAEAAELLIAQDNGDASLLYLHILKYNNANPKNWDQYRISKSLETLLNLGLYEEKEEEKTPEPQIFLAPTAAPTYNQNDINKSLESDNPEFGHLLEWVQAQFGKPFLRPDTESLLRLYAHMGMPADSIAQLVSWCFKEHRSKHGAYSAPTMRDIEREGVRWVNKGILSFESVCDHIGSLDKTTALEKRLMRLFQLKPSTFVKTTKKITDTWQAFDFSDEVYVHAHDITTHATGELKGSGWNYMNTILLNWHQAGYKSVQEIIEKDKNLGARPKPSKNNKTSTKPHNGPRKAETRAITFQDDDMIFFGSRREDSGNNNT